MYVCVVYNKQLNVPGVILTFIFYANFSKNSFMQQETVRHTCRLKV